MTTIAVCGNAGSGGGYCGQSALLVLLRILNRGVRMHSGLMHPAAIKTELHRPHLSGPPMLKVAWKASCWATRSLRNLSSSIAGSTAQGPEASSVKLEFDPEGTPAPEEASAVPPELDPERAPAPEELEPLGPELLCARTSRNYNML